MAKYRIQSRLSNIIWYVPQIKYRFFPFWFNLEWTGIGEISISKAKEKIETHKTFKSEVVLVSEKVLND